MNLASFPHPSSPSTPTAFAAGRSLPYWLGCIALAWTACASEPRLDDVRAVSPALEHDEHACEGEACGVRATLRDATGTVVGRVAFYPHDDATLVDAFAYAPAGQGGIRGMHVHANDDPDNGEGCLADPSQPESTHFASADGHYAPGHGDHGQHAGDMPALLFTASGEAAMRFLTDRVQPHALVGRAVIVHARADNYGNVPSGDAPDQYTANDRAAADLTARTGNAGARYACGVIE